MNNHSREALEAYYAEAGSWAEDRQLSLRRSRRTAWIIASGATVIAVCEAIALMVLMPLKTVEPYTLLVDRTTGYVQQLRPIEGEAVTPDAALTRSFLVQYVIAREGFDIDTVQTNYRKVGLWSADEARSAYIAGMQASNPASPLTLYPRDTVIEARVRSVSAIGENVALVRFETSRHDRGASAAPSRSWVAVMRYRYSGDPMSVEDRFINPLGFQVTEYRLDQEALPVATEPAAPGAPQPASDPTSRAAPSQPQTGGRP